MRELKKRLEIGFFGKKGKFPTAGIPMGAVITASGTGAEMNAGAVITYDEKMWKGPVFGTAADFAVLDPAYTMSVPPMQVLLIP